MEGEVADRFNRLERPREPGFEMYCYDCNKGLTYDTAENLRSRFYCQNCLCQSCGEPYDRARRATIKSRKNGRDMTICPKCVCPKCANPTIDGPYLEMKGKKGQKCCASCGCEVCRAGLEAVTIGGKRHCNDCLCKNCRASLADGYIEHNFLRYCRTCAPQTKEGGPEMVPDPNAPKCKACAKPLMGASMEFDGNFYHQNCLRCAGCKKAFSGGNVMVQEDKLFCEACGSNSCAQCGNLLGGATSFTVNGQHYHEECFVCTMCGAGMPDGRCAIIGGKPHCPKCASLPGVGVNPAEQPPAADAGAGCVACGNSLAGDSVGMAELKGKYHKRCFTCVHCSANLSAPGTRVYLSEQDPYCEACMRKLSGQ